MKANYAGRRFLQGLMSMSLLGIAGLAVVALGPGLMPSFGTEGADALAFNRPVAPAVVLPAQSVAANTSEAIVLANWEFTSAWFGHDHGHNHAHNPYGDAASDVLQALGQANEANTDSAQALLSKNARKAATIDAEAATDVNQAYRTLKEAATDVTGTSATEKQVKAALQADAAAMLVVYNQMLADLKTGNVVAIFQDTQNAQRIANKALLDVSPAR